MNKQKIHTKLAASLLAGAFSLGISSEIIAAESPGGVARYMDLTIKSTQQAQQQAKQGNKEGCAQNIKEARQHYKEITGDTAGMPMQRAMKKIKTAQTACEAGDTAKGADILTDALKDLEAIQGKM